MKLLIAVPALDYINVEFVRCLTALVQRLGRDGVDADVKILSGTLVYVARDRLAAHAINGGYTSVLWLDADMVFDDELLYDLQFAHKSFVSGIARSRRYPYTSCLFKSLSTLERFEMYPGDTFEVAGCGFACVLMDVAVLRAVREKYNTCFLPTACLGEDLAFCERARACGYQIYAEPGARVGHIGQITIYPDDAEALRAVNGVRIDAREM